MVAGVRAAGAETPEAEEDSEAVVEVHMGRRVG
jgi:hypothetical protein